MISFQNFYYLNESECTKTNEFKKWFKNSKVVDERGNPLRVYKSMIPYDEEGNLITSIKRQSDFPDFEKAKYIPNTNTKIAGFFTNSSEVANKFCFSPKCTIFPVYLSIQNPYVINAEMNKAEKFQFGETGKPFRNAISSGLYDGVIIKNTIDEGDIFIALKSNQIKSALCNMKFDPENPNLNESLCYLII
jgi:hypothetical protein